MYDLEAKVEARNRGECVHCKSKNHSFYECPKDGLEFLRDYFFYKRLSREEHEALQKARMRPANR